MNIIDNPFRIKLLLHFHCSYEQCPLRSSPVYQEEVDSLVKEGAIYEIHRLDCVPQYRTTPLGAAWVQALCSVPSPRMAFVDQLGNILE